MYRVGGRYARALFPLCPIYVICGLNGNVQDDRSAYEFKQCKWYDIT